MIYIILFILLFIFSIKYDYYGHRENRIYAYWFSIMLLILVAGFRYHVGLDSIRLSEWYQSCPTIFNLNNKFIEEESAFQPLWIILCSLLKTITPNFVLLQIVQTTIVNVLIFKFVLKKTTYIFSALLIYFLFAYVIFNFEILRESVAVALSLYAVLNYEKKKWLKYFIILFIAYEIHVSVIIVLLFPFILNIKIRRFHIIISLAIVIFLNIYYTRYIDLIFSVLSFDNGNISRHILTYTNAGDIGNSFKYYISIYLTGFIFPMLFLYLRNRNTEDRFKYSSLIVLYSIFSLLGNQSVAFLRFSNYQLIFYVILTAEAYQFLLKVSSNFLKRYYTPYLVGLLFSFVISFSFMYSMFKPVPYLDGGLTYCRYFPYYSIFYEEKNLYRERWSQLEFN